MDSKYEIKLKVNNLTEIIDLLLNNKKVLLYGSFKMIPSQVIDTLQLKDTYKYNSINISNLANISKKIEVLLRLNKNNTTKLINTLDFYSNRSSQDINILELYKLTLNDIYYNKTLKEYYNLLNENDFINDTDVESLLNLYSNIKSKIKISDYIKSSKFKNNKTFDILKVEASNDEIISVINKLSGIINNSFAFKPPLVFNEYTNDFIKNNILQNHLNEIELKELVHTINLNHNQHLLIANHPNHWYSLKGWITHIKEKSINKNVLSSLILNENNILNDYKENLENLTLFKSSFTFLNTVLIDSEFKKINNYILDADELEIWLINIFNILKLYISYRKVSESINILNSNELKLLDSCYNSIDTDKSLDKLLEFIPKFYMYKKIELIEKEASKRSLLDNVNTSITSINKSINEFIDLLKLYTSIKYDKIIENILDNSNMSLLFIQSYNMEDIEKDYYDKFTLIQNIDKLVYKENIIISSFQTSKSKVIEYKIVKLLYQIKYTISKKLYTLTNSYSILISNPKVTDNKVELFIDENCNFGENEIFNIIYCKSDLTKIIFILQKDWWLDEDDALNNLKKDLKAHLS